MRNLVRHLGDACAPAWRQACAITSTPTASGASPCSAARPSSAPRNWGLRYLDLTFAFHGIRLEVHDDEAHLVLDDAGIPEDLRIFLLERDAGGVLRIQRDLTGQCLPILRAGFRRPPPADPAPYVRELGLCPAFGQADNRVVFERRFLDLRCPAPIQRWRAPARSSAAPCSLAARCAAVWPDASATAC
ncbi:AraC family transcriptional regulator ligand-binding domain-containing protein [Pseudomonas aeruginosa]|nr:AraC family transcriptional regulator ligand-binding domain-containing protein [Pseudomonas aeruginosa]